MQDFHVPLSTFEHGLAASGERFWTGLAHGTMELLLYAPRDVDDQTPHSQDELYIVLRGTADFVNAGQQRAVKTGDALFVAAGAEHRFEGMSEDFATWALFWGPAGGERPA